MGAIFAAAAEFFTSEAVVGAATSAVVGAAANKLLSPGAKTPTLKPPTPMPDPLEQQRAKERSIMEQMARRGRSASILSTPDAGGTLGG